MHKQSAILLAACMAFGMTGAPALADACSGHSHGAGSVLGAVGGGAIGAAITHGSPVGVIGGAVAGGFAGNAMARDIDCGRGRHYDRHARAYYYYDRHDRRIYEDGHGHYYYRHDDHDGG